MARVEFKFDESAMKKLINDGVREVASRYQALLDELAISQVGRPLNEVKTALRSGWRKIGGDLTDPELTQYAEHLKDGERIEVRARQA
jgi:hypothetical protein